MAAPESTRSGPPAGGVHVSWARPLLIGAAATLAVLLTLDPSRGGPGVTPDEYYDTAAGKKFVQAWRTHGLGMLKGEQREAAYGQLTLHPPLGRWLLGWTHAAFDTRPDDPADVSLVAARFAPALAFGALVFLCGWFAARQAGPAAGMAAAAATAVCPRLFADAHFATLDTLTALFCFAACAALAVADERGGRWWHFLLAGFVWGLAALVKLHGLLLIAPAMVWFAVHYRQHAWRGGLIWLATGLVTFFVGWPWLWSAPWQRLKEFLGTATDRQPLHLFYWGQVWDDTAVPWHYPWVMLLVTLPLGLLALGLLGGWVNRTFWRDPSRSIVVLALGFMLVLFSWPQTPVYDGTRLFLLVYPCWAILAGDGLAWAAERLPERVRGTPWATALGGGLLAVQGLGIVLTHPCQLSYYNLLVGGLPGAEKLGFEVTYWGDAVQATLLRAAAEQAAGQVVVYGPNLAPYHVLAAAVASPELTAANMHLVGWDAGDPRRAAAAQWAIVYHRRADLAGLNFITEQGEMTAELSRRGVWLARLYRLPMTATALYYRTHPEEAAMQAGGDPRQPRGNRPGDPYAPGLPAQARPQSGYARPTAPYASQPNGRGEVYSQARPGAPQPPSQQPYARAPRQWSGQPAAPQSRPQPPQQLRAAAPSDRRAAAPRTLPPGVASPRAAQAQPPARAPQPRY